jgi:hypothetical protein
LPEEEGELAMNNFLFVVVLSAAILGADLPAVAQANDFAWRGTIARGMTIEIRGVHGSIRAASSEDDMIHVNARSSGPSLPPIEVTEHANGVTICVVSSTRQEAKNECRQERRGAELPVTEQRVEFIVRVPAGVRLQGSMIDGDIEVESLRSEVNVATIDGNIALNVPADYDAELYGNTIAGTIESNLPVHELTPPLPSGRSTSGPRLARATIGNGGPALRATTVNGNIRFWRR